ncbi:MAG: SDR family oxidoreductase [Proteobacteria bacterium]|nr:SDR family oxidoreductase [Pseudomonadota bacterium]
MGLESYRGLAALVTGASSGIGREIALRLAKEGARVALVARREAELEAVAEEIRALSGEAIVLPCDVAESGQVAEVARRAVEAFGSIDILVNNAGYGGQASFLDWDLEDMERMMRVNYFGTLYFTKALLPQMVERKRGWLVFVSSVSGRIASPEKSAYAATKFAMTGLAEGLSLDLEIAQTGVNLLTVYPGVVRTPFFSAQMLKGMSEKTKNSMVEPEGLVDAIFVALAKGKRELTFPGGLSAGYVVKALAPEFLRKQVLRVTKK